MQLTRLAIRRPLTMLMIILAMVILGYQSLTLLRIDRYPEVDLPFVSVVVTFPGASPEDVEELVVKPIEDVVAGISGIDIIQSNANESFGVVIIGFVEGTDGDQAAIEVERLVATVQLPDDASDPTVLKADFNAFPIMQAVLSGPQGQDKLYELAENDIKPRLQTVEGVASVSVSGGRTEEVQVLADPNQLAGYGVPIEAIQQYLQINNLTFPVGSVEEGRQRTSIRSVGDYTSLEEIEQTVVGGLGAPGAPGGMPVPGMDTGGLIYLKDVADVQRGYKDENRRIRYNGLDTVNISVVKTNDSNTISVADDIRHAIENLNEELPDGAQMTIIVDDSQFTRESVNAVGEDLVLAILITSVVILLFLHTIRSTFIVLLAIPTSILSTFIVMYALGYSLNVLTLLALTLTIGILVDDSIVVIENIERHLKMKKPPKLAALDGRSEIGLAAITITMVDVVVYIPIAFTSGIIGQFFRSYGVTIATTTLFSLFIAFTLTPMLAAYWMKDESKPEGKPRGLNKVFSTLFKPVGWVWNGFIRIWNKGFDALANFYAYTLKIVLLNAFTKIATLMIALAALVLGGWMVGSGYVESEFMPQEDDGQLRISIEMPPGTTLGATDLAAQQVEQIVFAEVPEAVVILTSVGGGGGGADIFEGVAGGSNAADITVRLTDKTERIRSTTDVVEDLRPLLKEIPEANISVQLTSFMAGGAAPIQLQVYGPDPDRLIDLANEVEAALKTVPGTVDVLNLDAARAPEAQIIIDRQRVLNMGLSPAQVAGTLRTSLSGANVGSFKQTGDVDLDLTVRVNEDARKDLTSLLQMPLGYRNGQPILLNQVATIERSQTPARVTRVNRQRTLTISSGVTGRASGSVTDDAEAAINAQVVFPPEYDYEFAGTSEQQRESFAQLTNALGLSIILIYMLLVALYQSFMHPLAIMFSLPVALVGAFGGLWITDNTLNIFSMLGIILLAGVVTKNAVLLVDFTNQLREERGYSKRDALVEAGRLRLRPIFMTTFSLVFALLPLLLGTTAGSETRAPLAAVVIGGTLSSTFLTLIVVPVVYTFFDALGARTTRLFRALFGSEEVSDTPPASGDDGDGDNDDLADNIETVPVASS